MCVWRGFVGCVCAHLWREQSGTHARSGCTPGAPTLACAPKKTPKAREGSSFPHTHTLHTHTPSIHTYPPHTHTLHTHIPSIYTDPSHTYTLHTHITHIPSTYTYAPHTQTHHTHTLHTHTTHIPSTHTHTLHSVGTCQGAPAPPDGCCLCRAVLPGVDVRRELRDRALQPGGPRLQETAPVQLPRGQCPHLHQVGHSAESITPGARHLDPSPVSDSCGFEQLPQS